MNSQLEISIHSCMVYAPDFIEIIVPTEYDNNSSQIPMAKYLFYYCKTKRIIFRILGTFLKHTVHDRVSKSAANFIAKN